MRGSAVSGRWSVVRQLLAVGVSVLALAVAQAGADDRERTGPDSFLPYRAYTVEALVDQVERDPVVRKRLAKHFHVPEAELVSYFRKNLRVVSFTSTGWRPIYGVTRTGRIYRSRDHFRRGAKAFGLKDGTAVLKFACGNPLITKLPPAPRKPTPRKIVEAPPQPWQPPIESLPEVMTPPVHDPQEFALLPEVPQVPVIAVPAAVPQVVQSAIPLWPLAGVPLLLIHGGDDGPEPVPTPPPIPEPTSVLLLATGLGLLGGRLLIRRRRG